ncbi:MAG: response regulator [Chloroflexota bacterium]
MKTISAYLRNLITPPSFDNDNVTRIVRPLYFTLWALFVPSLVLGLLGVIREGNFSGGKGISLVFALAFACAIYFLRRKFLDPVRYSLPLFIWLGLTYTVATDGGIRDVDIIGFALVVAIAGLLVNSRASIIFGVLSLLTLAVLYWLEISGRLVSSSPDLVTREEFGVVFTILLIVTFLVYYGVNHLEQLIQRAQADAHLLTQRNQQLRQAQTDLQEQTTRLAVLNKSLQEENQDRQQVTEALRLSEAKNRAILDYLPDMILRINAEGYFVDFSPSNHLDPVAPPEFFIGKHITELLPPEVAGPGVAALNDALATNEVQVFEYPMMTDDDERIFESRNIPIPGREVLTIVRDITDDKRSEQAALQAQKLESIGLLAGGIAHDFNNLLTGMMGQNSLALLKLPAESPARRHLEKSVVSAKRAADLTRQLLAYAGKGQFLVEPIDLNQLVQEGAGLLETVLPKQAKLCFELADSLPTIEIDRGQIQQILMNLVINAAEAIGKEGGDVTICTKLMRLTAVTDTSDFVAKERVKPGPYVCLQISDTGRGVSEADKKRIFDPYYSTKGQGRGLGLSATLGIIRSYEGHLALSSVLGEGSQFRVYFPAGAYQDVEETSVFATATPKKGNVLVVDDEIDVQETAKEILETAGFRVFVANDGRQGTELFAKLHKQINVVLLDIHMPNMNGEQAFHKMREIDSQTPIIFSSGYTEIILPNLVNQTQVAFLQKPYDIDGLVNKVQEMLSA